MDDFHFAQEREQCFLGYAKIPLRNLHFEEGIDGIGTRIVKRKEIDFLLNRFKADRCRRDEPLHSIPALVMPEQLRLFLDHNSLPISRLRDGEPVTLTLLPGWEVSCLQGRVRVAAATEWLAADNQWWIIGLYDKTRISNEGRRRMREHRDVSQELISGEIYRNVRSYQQRGNDAEANEWMSRWNPHNLRDFKQLQRRDRGDIYKPLREALDKLLEFPGLWSTYVNLHRLLPMRVPEEQANYLIHIQHEWNRIADGRPQIVDAQTVELLEGRSPLWSVDDHDYIADVFAEGMVFSDITDPRTRTALYERVICTARIIPSLRTFHEDCKYLEPLAKLTRGLLSPKYRGSIQEGMKRRYQPPRDNNFYIQTSETGYRQEHQIASYGFWSAYRQLFLAAMRSFFPVVPGFSPLKMHKVTLNMLNTSLQDPMVLSSCFTELARDIGFSFQRSRSLQRHTVAYGQWIQPGPVRRNQGGLAGRHYSANANPALTTNAEEEWSLGARCGMTDGVSFFLDKEYLYMDNIYSSPTNQAGRNLTTFAVKRDFFLAFFPPFAEPRRIETQDVAPLSHPLPSNTSGIPSAPQPLTGLSQNLPNAANSEDVAMGDVSQFQQAVREPNPPSNGEVIPQSQQAEQDPSTASNDEVIEDAQFQPERMADAPTQGRRQTRKLIGTNKWGPLRSGEASIKPGKSWRKRASALAPYTIANPRRVGQPNQRKQRTAGDSSSNNPDQGSGIAQQATAAPTTTLDSLIVEQNEKWCLFKFSTTVGRYAGAVAKYPTQTPPFGCIIYPYRGLAMFFLCSHAEGFRDIVSRESGEGSGFWFADITPTGILSLVQILDVEALLRDGKVLVMGASGRDEFNQGLLHPGFEEDTVGMDVPSFNGSEWEIEL